jgi:hypothetical protein
VTSLPSSSFTLVRPGMGHGRAHHETIEVVTAREYTRMADELAVLRVAAHSHVEVIRGMCTDEVDHREIDRALVRLDDLVTEELS